MQETSTNVSLKVLIEKGGIFTFLLSSNNHWNHTIKDLLPMFTFDNFENNYGMLIMHHSWFY